VASGRARILAVEKSGVEFLDYPPDGGDARACRPEFLAEYTLDRWATTIADAIQAARKLPGVAPSKTLVIGISEGGIVAMRVSNISPQVTHVASLSGGGPVYLFHIAEYMRSKGLDPEREVYACWSDILKDPDSVTKQPTRSRRSLGSMSCAPSWPRSGETLCLSESKALTVPWTFQVSRYPKA
jgi:pimeloyl-ACP methyl ester carboxylesterase